MTAKRFNSYCDNENIRIRIDDDIKNKEVFHIYFAELEDAIYCKSKLNPILDLLNQLSEENEQLKTQLQNTSDQRDEFHRGARENANHVGKLEKENEQLKKENYELHKRLGDFELFERYMKKRTSKTSVNDIIGLVKTDEPTNSVELKKELYK